MAFRPELSQRQITSILAMSVILSAFFCTDFSQADESPSEPMESLEHLNDMLGNTESMADTNQIATALLDLGHAHRARGQYDQAHACYQRSIELAVLRGDDQQRARCLVSLGSIHRLEARPEKAVAFLEHAHNIMQTVPALVPARDCLLELAQAYEDLGDHQQALESYKLYKTASDRIITAEGREKVAELQARHELERHEHETALRKPREALNQLGRERDELVRSVLNGALIVIGSGLFLIIRRGRENARINQLLRQANEQLELQKTEFAATFDALNLAQSQLWEATTQPADATSESEEATTVSSSK